MFFHEGSMTELQNILSVREKMRDLRTSRPGKISYACIDPKVRLYLRVSQTGRGDFAYRRKKPPIVRLLGPVETMEMAEAMALCLEYEAKIMRKEEIPVKQVQRKVPSVFAKGTSSQAEAMTLGGLLRAWFPYEAESGRWSLDSGRAVVKFDGIIRNHLEPRLSQSLPELTATLIEGALTSIYRQHRSSAISLRSWVCGALRWAEDVGFLENGRLLAAQVKEDLADRWKHIKHGAKMHHAALSIEQAPLFYAELSALAGTAAQACRMAMLTCMRTSSVTHMRWQDIDFEARTWICPPEFMKEKKNGTQTVYLSRQALKIIQSMPRILRGGKQSEWVFSTSRGERICSDLCKVIESMNARRIERGLEPWLDLSQTDPKTGKHPRVTVHGFRATFKTWSRSELLGNWSKYDEVAVEKCLHHVPRDSYGGAYDREAFPKLQRTILQDWADFLESSQTPVLAF